MLTCRELTELITDYLEGRLPIMQRLRFRFHIAMCRPCLAYLRQMKIAIRTLGKLPEEGPPPAVREEFLRRFRDWKR